MKIIDKSELLIMLKDIVSKLEANKIYYEIPYMFLNKKTFNYIEFIISIDVETKELISLIDCDKSTEKGNIIQIYKDDFLIRFIKSDNIFHDLVMYSWNILTPLLKLMFKNYNLEYNEKGLFFKYDKVKILLSEDFKEIFNFLKISFNSFFITKNITDYYSYYAIYNSNLYKKSFFTLEKIKEIDSNYEYNLEYYNEFLLNLPENSENEIDIIDLIIINFEKFEKELKQKINVDKGVIKENIKIKIEKIKIKHDNFDEEFKDVDNIIKSNKKK
jgi:hypothetical protein